MRPLVVVVSAGLLIQGIALLAFAAEAPPAPAAVSPAQAEFFEKSVRPVLAQSCYACHGPGKQFASLRLDSRAGLLMGGDKGPVLTPGDPEKSRLIAAIRQTGALKMPPNGKLSDKAIADLTVWVKDGAPWPASAAGPTVKTMGERITEERTKHWSFQPVKKQTPPAVKDKTWAANAVDRFILAKLEAKGLKPSPPADRLTLIRRATFDLTGLPPTPAEVVEFVNDRRPDAYAKLIDRLLASPHYGERWGRHWLDVARYADTLGYLVGGTNDIERKFPFAFTYRDYVIRSLNEDKPYDRFVQEQLAADQLELKDKRDLAALGYVTVGNHFLGATNEIIDDRIDVVSRGLQAMTVGCARCHDHKFDAIPTADYYSLYGVFAASREPGELPVISESPDATAATQYRNELATLTTRLSELQKKGASPDEVNKVKKELLQLNGFHPGAPARAMVLEDQPNPGNPRVFLRGNQGTPGQEVPRQFLVLVSGEQRQPFKKGSGRLELAQAITSRDNPLTARVMVNRIWMHHFGKGLVTTPSDFGVRGELPTHPELLDYLATYFMDHGWSMKEMHRLLMLSRTYQESSVPTAAQMRVDADNKLLGHMNRQRLDFEGIRDSMLAVTGTLDETIGGRPVDILEPPYSKRRTLYAYLDRQNLPGIYRTFDFADPNAHAPQRYATTVPQQALYLMNSSFVEEMARQVVVRPGIAAQKTSEARIQQLYRVLFGRSPSADEVALGLGFLKKSEGEQDTPSVETAAWQYGWGEYDPAAKRLKAYKPMPHFTGASWQGGPKLPDPQLTWVSLNAQGGHPGNDLAHSAVRRWVAPRDMVISIHGSVSHPSDQGDGIHATVISSRAGEVGGWVVQHQTVNADVARVEVKRGDTLDFVVDCRTNSSFDSFSWAPGIEAIETGTGNTGGQTVWEAGADFGGPVTNAAKPLTPWETYVQALLLTNEFLYID